MINVLIVEDDPMVAELNKRYIESVEGFRIIGKVSNGKDALIFCEKKEVHLVILDVYMPKMDGISFLKEFRTKFLHTEVIMVTASTDINDIETALKLGALDYLIKPFEYERLKKALGIYQERHDFFHKKEDINQKDIDNLYINSGGENSLRKGLHKKTLDLIREFLQNHSEYHTSENIAEALNLSKVTIRKYLEYLETTGELKMIVEYGIGRPTHRFRYLKR